MEQDDLFSAVEHPAEALRETQEPPESTDEERSLQFLLASGLPDNVTLGEARKWLEDKMEQGVHCPTCTQYAKIYKRQINSQMARALIALHRVDMADVHGDGYLPFPDVLRAVGIQRADEAKLAHWGLIEEESVRRPDGGRAGFWRVTLEGLAFVRGERRVQKYARIFDGLCLGFEGDWVTIQQCLGANFDYTELMSR